MKFTAEDIDTAIIRTTSDQLLQLASYDYMAGMAGYTGNLDDYDPEARCLRCGRSRTDGELWEYVCMKTWTHTDEWECTDCVLKSANDGDERQLSWYKLIN